MLKVLVIIILTFIFLINPIQENFEDEPVDVVYTWVDGNDKNWIKKKNNFLPKEYSRDANEDIRFKNINELKYSLRSIEKFAPWINHIYIVVDDEQSPNFLKKHPKLTIIKHSQIMKDIPTFNSQAIEANLQNIPGLSNNFIYFNDDCFLGNYLKKTDMISRGGKPYYFKNFDCKFQGEPLNEDEGYVSAWKNTFNTLNKDFKKQDFSCLWHHPILLKKSLINNVKNKYKILYNRTSASKFRHKMNIPPIGFAVHYGKLNGDYEERKPHNNIYFNYPDSKDIKPKLNNIKETKPLFFCINNIIPNDNTNELLKFFEEYYPNKSEFEICLKT